MYTAFSCLMCQNGGFLVPPPGSKGFLQRTIVHQVLRRCHRGGELTTVLLPHTPAAPINATITVHSDAQPLLPPPNVAHEPVFVCYNAAHATNAECFVFEPFVLYNALVRLSAPQSGLPARGESSAVGSFVSCCWEVRQGAGSGLNWGLWLT